MTYRRNNGDWVRVEQLVRETEPRYDSENEYGFMRGNHVSFLVNTANYYAATGRDVQADAYVAAARREYARINAELGTDSPERAFQEATQQNTLNGVELARLNHAALRENANAVLAKLAPIAKSPGYEQRVRSAQAAAHLALGRAAFNTGDHETAYREFALWQVLRNAPALREQQSRQDRAGGADNDLTWARALFSRRSRCRGASRARSRVCGGGISPQRKSRMSSSRRS